jgi:hypothetical protein
MGVLIDSKQFELAATGLALYNKDGWLVSGFIIALVVCHCQDV